MIELSDFLRRLVAALTPVPLKEWGFPGSQPAKRELRWANTGGPRSRVVSTPVVSRLLSEGSATLGITPLDTYAMGPRHSGVGFREIALRLLRLAGFASPEEAWDSLRDALPDRVALAVDTPPTPAADDGDARQSLVAALVLGKCCGSLFSPGRPIIWSERRLARSLRLVDCDSDSFTRPDDE
jgi:hypothetical protein